MSWFTNLVHSTTSTNQTASTNSAVKGEFNLYISIDATKACFLLIDSAQNPNKIVSWEEFYLGPMENLQNGEPVRDIFSSLTKLFTVHKDKFAGTRTISVSLPADGVFFRTVEVPKMVEADMQKLILAEIKKTLPVDFSQVLFAQNDLGEKHNNMRSFFCVGIQKNLFENYKTLFSKFNISPYFEIETFSLARISKRDKESRLLIQVGRLNTFLIFLEGQIVQEVKLLDIGENDINNKMVKDLGIKFDESELLKTSFSKLLDAGRMGAQIVDEYVKEMQLKLAKAVSLNILEHEKAQNVEIKEVIISGSLSSNKLKKIIHDEFDSELKVDFVNEENFGTFVAENFSLDELKRYAQCFGLALRKE